MMLRGPMGRAAVASIVLIALWSGAANAASSDVASLDTPSPAVLTGAIEATAPSGTFLLSTRAGHERDRVMDAAAITATRLAVTQVNVTMPVVAASGIELAYEPRYDNWSFTLEEATGRVTTTGRDVTLIAHPTPGREATLAARLNVAGEPTEPLGTPLTYMHGMEADRPYLYSHSIPAEAFGFRSRDDGRIGVGGTAFSARASGDVSLFLTDGTLSLQDASGRTLRVSASAPGQDSGTGSGIVHGRTDTYSFILVEAVGAELSAAGREGYDILVALDAPSVHVDGKTLFPRAEGTVHADGRAIEVTGSDVRVQGNFSLSPLTGDASALPRESGLAAQESHRYHVTGTFTSVDVAGIAAHTITPSAEQTLAVAALTTLLAALTAAGRATLGSLLGVFYTRLAPADVLRNQERRKIVATVHAHPGIHMRDVQRRVGFGWGKLHYHVNVLRKNNVLRTERQSKFLLLYSSAQETAGPPRLDLRGSAATIYRALPRDGGVTQRDLSARLDISRQLVGYHLRALVSEGLVKATRHRPKRYVRTP